jgi:hypothetical protein
MPNLNPIPVESSWVKTIWWLDGLLRVTTKKGATITRLCPEGLWRQFQASTSKGEFFNKHLKQLQEP